MDHLRSHQNLSQDDVIAGGSQTHLGGFINNTNKNLTGNVVIDENVQNSTSIFVPHTVISVTKRQDTSSLEPLIENYDNTNTTEKNDIVYETTTNKNTIFPSSTDITYLSSTDIDVISVFQEIDENSITTSSDSVSNENYDTTTVDALTATLKTTSDVSENSHHLLQGSFENYILTTEGINNDYQTPTESPIFHENESTTKSQIVFTNKFNDFEITTAQVDLDVDHCDEYLDPSKIARATSYETSMMATVTRSATVTTKVDSVDDSDTFLSTDVDRSFDASKYGNFKGNESIFLKTDNMKNNGSEQDDNIMENVNTTEDPEYVISTVRIDTNEREKLHNNFVLNTSDNINTGRKPTEYHVLVQTNKTAKEKWDLNQSLLFQNSSDLEKLSANFENSTSSINKSLLITLGVVSSFIVILIILITSLWLIKRHRNHSKIYLSFEAAKPRAFLTKPMSPACFPDEVKVDIVVPSITSEKPKPPIVLCDENTVEINKIVSQVLRHAESEDSGLENLGFVEIPLEDVESQTPNPSLGSSESRVPDPPKYRKSSAISDSDSGIKVWSSSGSLYSASTLTKCLIPPPPYILPLGKEHAFVEESDTKRKWNLQTGPPLSSPMGIAGLHMTKNVKVNGPIASSTYDGSKSSEGKKLKSPSKMSNTSKLTSMTSVSDSE